MAGTFEVYTDKAGIFRFRLKAGTGQITATGEAYETKPVCMNGVESVQANAPGAKIKELADA